MPENMFEPDLSARIEPCGDILRVLVIKLSVNQKIAMAILD